MFSECSENQFIQPKSIGRPEAREGIPEDRGQVSARFYTLSLP